MQEGVVRGNRPIGSKPVMLLGRQWLAGQLCFVLQQKCHKRITLIDPGERGIIWALDRGHLGLMVQTFLYHLKRGIHAENSPTVLDCDNSTGGKRPAVANSLHHKQYGYRGVTGA